MTSPFSPRRLRQFGALAVVVGSSVTLVAQTPERQPSDQGGSFKFKSRAELINVTATVSDRNERFVAGLRREDFTLHEDGAPQPITHFSDERVPVSLGLVLDTSGSMEGEKWQAAREAIDRFLDLLGPDDEVFLYSFSNRTTLLEEWTTDRNRIVRALGRIEPRGGTAMYDAVAEAVPIAQSGSRRKKAIVVISDGNDRNSSTDVRSLRSLIRETEVLVYAVGIDGESEPTLTNPRVQIRPAALAVSPSGPEPAAVSPPAAATLPAHAGGWQRRSRQRQRASGDDRRQRRPHGNRSQRPRSGAGRRRNRRRVEPPVLARLRSRGAKGRPLALDRAERSQPRLSGAGTQRLRGYAMNGDGSLVCVQTRRPSPCSVAYMIPACRRGALRSF